MSSTDLNPMEVMRGSTPEGARTYMQLRESVMDNPELRALSTKTKLLVGIGVASALQSSMCTLMWAKQAREAGVQDAEIAEAILVARLLKAATVNDTAAEALLWLTQNPASAGRTMAPTSPEGA